MWFGWLLRVRRISNTVKAHENSKYATIVSFYTESKENKNNILLMNNITKLLLQLIVANFFGLLLSHVTMFMSSFSKIQTNSLFCCIACFC